MSTALPSSTVAGPVRPTPGAEENDSARGRRARARAAVPGLVWALTVLHLLLMVGYAVLYPPYLNPDEAQHVDLVVAAQEEKVVWAPGERLFSQAILTTFEQSSIRRIGQADPSAVPLETGTIPVREDRPSLRELGFDRPAPESELPNQLVQHPPLYYATAAGVLELLPGSDVYRWDVTLGALRLLGALLLTPLPLLVFLVGRRLCRDRPWVPQVAAAGVLLVPGLSRAGGSVTNDDLAVLLAASLAVPLAGVLRPPVQRETGVAWSRAVAVGVLLGLLALTKGTGLVMAVSVVAVYLVAAVRRRRVLWAEMALAAALSMVVGGWWWVRNLVLYGVLQPSGLGAAAYERLRGPAAPPDVERSGVEFVLAASWKLIQLFIGALGLFTPPRFSPWLVSSMAVAAVLAVVAVLLMRTTVRRADIACFLLPVVVLYGLLLGSAYPWYLHNLSYPGLQGRYLYFLLPGLLLAVAAGVDALLPARVRRFAVVGCCVAAIGLQAWAVWRVFSFLWDGLPGPGWTPQSLVRGAGVLTLYSPWPPAVTLAVPVAVVSAAVLVVVVSVVTARRPVSPAIPTLS